MERDLMQAGIKKDVATMSKIYADDWVGIGPDGKSIVKVEAMAEVNSGAYAVQSAELSAMKVRVFGNTAVVIVTGSDSEKSTYKGKHSTGTYAWTDAFVMRQGHWPVAASQSTKVEK